MRNLRQSNFSLRNDIDFNPFVYLDIFYMSKKHILRAVDEVNKYHTTRRLLAYANVRNPTTCHDTTGQLLWCALRLCWIDVYLGPPDIIEPESGVTFLAHASQASYEMLHFQPKAFQSRPHIQCLLWNDVTIH